MNDVWALLRLSRPELEKPGSMEEKFKQQRAMAQDMARRYDLDLPNDHILVEQVSGQYLAKRPELQRLLDLMHAGRCRYLIAPFEDRIDRLQDKRDQAELEDALYAGAVTVISRDGVVRYDDDLDPFPVEMRAAFARHEARKYSVRMRAKKEYRLRQNKPNAGIPSYGYRKLPNGMTVNQWRERNGMKPLSSGGDVEMVYEADPIPFAVMEGVFRRLLQGTESLRSIADDLGWDYSTLYGRVHNPIYAGYHARQTRPVRNKGYRRLSPDQYVLAEGEPGAWPKLITLADYHEIRLRFARFRNPMWPRRALLTGILHCPSGQPMRAGGGASPCYQCGCPGNIHNAVRHAWDGFARSAFTAFVESVPDDLLQSDPPKPTDRLAIKQEYARGVASLREKQIEYDRLVRESVTPDSLLRRFNAGEVERIISDLERELQDARDTVAYLGEAMGRPDAGEAITALKLVREHGAAYLWDEATAAQRREMLRVVFLRITLHPRDKFKFFRGASIEWQEWVTDRGLQIPIDPSWFPKRSSNRDYRKQNARRQRDERGRYL